MNERILIAEDEDILRANLVEFLAGTGYAVDGVGDGAAALARVTDEDYALAIVDLRMPHLDGIGLLKRIVATRPETLVLIMTAYASIESAVEALHLGAHDYLLKPVVFEDLLKRVENLLAYRALKSEVVRLRRDLSGRLGFHGIVGESPAMRQVFELVDKVAPTNATVLITGESGTGKELVARAIHARSAVKDREFLAFNVAALPQELIESQLFGHERGAFTGADRRRDGLLRSVQGGSVFLDEVGELPVQAQAKLLRALESGEVLPVGADRPARASFRLITATNRHLEAAIADGRFRQDLYFRLNVFRIELPPLRERREDIPALVSHFVGLHSRAQGKTPPDRLQSGDEGDPRLPVARQRARAVQRDRALVHPVRWGPPRPRRPPFRAPSRQRFAHGAARCGRRVRAPAHRLGAARRRAATASARRACWRSTPPLSTAACRSTSSPSAEPRTSQIRESPAARVVSPAPRRRRPAPPLSANASLFA